MRRAIIVSIALSVAGSAAWTGFVRFGSEQFSAPAATTQPAVAATMPAKPATRTERGSLGSPISLAPAESLLVWKVLPLVDDEAATAQQSDPLATLLQLGMTIFQGTLDAKARLTIDVLQSFGEIARHPFALALIDARARPGDKDKTQSRKIDKLRLAVIIKVTESENTLRQLVERVVGRHTDAGQATLVRAKASGWSYSLLRDKRLPEWSNVAWGRMDGYFVFALGEDVWPLIAAVARGEKPGIDAEAWFARVRGTQNDEPLIEILVASKAIRQRLDPFVHGRATAFFKAWGAQDTDQAH